MDDTPAGLLIIRCQNAHNNGLEFLSYGGLSILAAAVAGLPAGTRAFYALLLVVIRIVYNIIYVGGDRFGNGPLRSVVWVLGMVISMVQLIQCGLHQK